MFAGLSCSENKKVLEKGVILLDGPIDQIKKLPVINTKK